MDTLIRRFAARLHNLRMERRLSQEALAAKAGLHVRYVSMLERAKQMPSLNTLALLAKGLNLDLPGLLDFPEPSSGKSADRVAEELALINRTLKNRNLDEVRKARKIIEAYVG